VTTALVTQSVQHPSSIRLTQLIAIIIIIIIIIIITTTTTIIA